MTEPSLDQDTGDDPDGRAERSATTTRTTRWPKVVGSLGLVVMLWVGNEMYDALYGDTGGGPDHGGPGGGESPAENQEQEIDTDENGDDDGDVGEHDPSQFDHG